MNNQFEARDYGYTVISRFEELLRQSIVDFLDISEGNFVDYIPKGVVEAAKERMRETGDIEAPNQLLENTDFIHLKEIILYKDNYKSIINESVLERDAFGKLMGSLYDVRCKIDHIRTVFTSSDLSFLMDETQRINSALLMRNRQFDEFVKQIKIHPNELVIKTPIDFFVDESIVSNNLPIADYEFEGGFVGRGDDVEALLKMMKLDRYHVITVAGAGGVGKSALVLKTVNEIVDRKIINYDFVVWVSAKENKLSYLGIEDIEPTLKSYEELLDTILEVFGIEVGQDYGDDIQKKEKDINILFDACDKVLIVIDNLETISDERIINFILDYHPHVYFIITSRRGLGQIERRYDLKELKEKDASHLFRVICKEKGLTELQKADEKTIIKYVKKVYCYPLAIKWVLGHAAMGKDISSVIDNINEQSSDISRFCFEQVFSELNTHAQSVLYALCLENDPVPQGVLKYISNLGDVDFEDTIKDLLLVSMILPEQRVNKDNNEIHAYYSLLPLTRGYVRTQLDRNRDEKQRIQQRIISVENINEEANRAQIQYKYSLSNYGATTDEEKIAAMFATTAYQKYQTGNYIDAVESFKKAINIAPRFAPVYRNWAIIESMESNWADADRLMSKAAELSPNDTQIWLAWGNIKKKSDRIKEAYDYYQKAYKLSPEDNVVLNSCAQIITRMGEYERADNMFKKALKLVDGIPNKKHLIINYASIAENLRRWSESLIKDRDYDKAINKLEEAKEAIKKVLGIDRSDVKAKETYADIWMMLGNTYEKLGERDKAMTAFEEVKCYTEDSKKYKTTRLYFMSVLRIADLLMERNDYDSAENLLSKEEKNIRRVLKNIGRELDSQTLKHYRSIKERLQSANQQREYGIVERVNYVKKYMVIRGSDHPEFTYLGFFSECEEYISSDKDIENREVSYRVVEENGKRLACNIEFVLGI